MPHLMAMASFPAGESCSIAQTVCWVLINRKHSHNDSFSGAKCFIFILMYSALHMSVGHECMNDISSVFIPNLQIFQTFVRYLFFVYGQCATFANPPMAKTLRIKMKQLLSILHTSCLYVAMEQMFGYQRAGRLSDCRSSSCLWMFSLT